MNKQEIKFTHLMLHKQNTWLGPPGAALFGLHCKTAIYILISGIPVIFCN